MEAPGGLRKPFLARDATPNPPKKGLGAPLFYKVAKFHSILSGWPRHHGATARGRAGARGGPGGGPGGACGGGADAGPGRAVLRGADGLGHAAHGEAGQPLLLLLLLLLLEDVPGTPASASRASAFVMGREVPAIQVLYGTCARATVVPAPGRLVPRRSPPPQPLLLLLLLLLEDVPGTRARC